MYTLFPTVILGFTSFSSDIIDYIFNNEVSLLGFIFFITYIIFIVFICFKKIKKSNIFNINLVVISFFGTLVILSFGSQFTKGGLRNPNYGPSWVVDRTINPNFDKRSKIKTMYDSFDSEEKKYASINPNSLSFKIFLERNQIHHPIVTSGITNKNTVLCNETGQWISYRSDKYGFRNKNYVYDENNKIIFIGDSATHGYCYEEGGTYSDIFRKAGYNVINHAVEATGPLTQFLIFKEFSIKQKPKKIIWFFFDNDYVDFNKEIQDQVLKNYFNNEQDYDLIKNLEIDDKIKTAYLKSDQVRSRFKLYSNFFYRNFLLGNLKRHQGISYSILENDLLKGFKKQDKILNIENKPKKRTAKVNKSFSIFDLYSKVHKITQKEKIEFLFVILPHSLYSPAQYNTDNKYNLISFLMKNKINFIDLSQSYYQMLKNESDEKISKMFPSLDHRTESHFTQEAVFYLMEYLLKKIRCLDKNCNVDDKKISLFSNQKGTIDLYLNDNYAKHPYRTDLTPKYMKKLYIEEQLIKSFRLDIIPLSIEKKIKVKIDFKEFLSAKDCEKLKSGHFHQIKLINKINNCKFEILTTGPNSSVMYASSM